MRKNERRNHFNSINNYNYNNANISNGSYKNFW